jgi:hypothetical protein
MKSIIFGLSLVSFTTAQIVNGLSSVPATGASSVPAATSAPAVTPTPAVAAVTSAPAVTPAPSLNNAQAAPPQYTQPPPGSDFYQYMSYDSWKAGGYKQLQCGYGYQKAYDGSCQPYSWYTPSIQGCYATIIINENGGNYCDNNYGYQQTVTVTQYATQVNGWSSSVRSPNADAQAYRQRLKLSRPLSLFTKQKLGSTPTS